MRKYLVEFIGTFFLAFTVATAAVFAMAPSEGGLSLAPFAIGIVLMVMIYAGGHVSGGHFNPAVTLGVFLRGRCDAKDVAPYMIAQLLAAVIGGFVAATVCGSPKVEVMAFGNSGAVLISEFLFTFALVYVVINTATSKANEGNSFYGLAIGGTVAAGALTVGGISLGGFNPAVSLMLAISGKLAWVDSWMHFLPQILGGALAAFAFKFICPDDR